MHCVCTFDGIESAKLQHVMAARMFYLHSIGVL